MGRTGSPDEAHRKPTVPAEVELEAVGEPLDPRSATVVGRGRAVDTAGIRTACVERAAQMAGVPVVKEVLGQFLRRRNMGRRVHGFQLLGGGKGLFIGLVVRQVRKRRMEWLAILRRQADISPAIVQIADLWLRAQRGSVVC